MTSFMDVTQETLEVYSTDVIIAIVKFRFTKIVWYPLQCLSTKRIKLFVQRLYLTSSVSSKIPTK